MYELVLLGCCCPPPTHLDGGCEGSRDVGAQAGGDDQLGGVLLLPECRGDALLAQQLQAGHAVFHAHHVQRRAARQEQT